MISTNLSIEIFIDASKIGIIPQMFLALCYGYILFQASTALSTGSEMLLGLYGAGIVGGLVIPILGALPDCALILFSGLGNGPMYEILHELEVGIGTLAGSTIMILTLPWGASIFLARRAIDPETGEAAFKLVGNVRKPIYDDLSWSSLKNDGVTVFSSVPFMAKVMIATSISYLLIQIPSMIWSKDERAADKEHYFALAALLSTIVLLMIYCYYQVQSAQADEISRTAQREIARRMWKDSLKTQLGDIFEDQIVSIFRKHDKDGNGYLDRGELTGALRELGLKADRKEVNMILREMDNVLPHRLDYQDNRVSLAEFSHVIKQWMLQRSEHDQRIFATQPGTPKADDIVPNTSSAPGTIAELDDVDRKATVMYHLQYADITVPRAVSEEEEASLLRNTSDSSTATNDSALSYDAPRSPHVNVKQLMSERNVPEEANQDVEGEDEEYNDLNDDDLLRTALLTLTWGTVLVCIFSDPMIGVIKEFSLTVGLPPFYVAFFVTPLISNISEILSSFQFAKKKSNTGISLAHSTYYGAATMNNTMGLSIFLGLVFFRKLQWIYSAEVSGILLVTYVVGWIGMRRTLYLWHAVLAMSMLPVSITVIAILRASGYH